MTRTPVEIAAEAMAATVPDYWGAHRLEALAQVALSALEREGFVVVPKEPTTAMLEAGCEGNPTIWHKSTDAGFALGVAIGVYRAMIAARPQDGGGV